MSTPTPTPTLLFAGLGAMGHAMASHLLRSGYAVIGYDVHPPALSSLLSQGGHPATTPRAAARDVDVLIVMVANHRQATPLLFDAATGAVEGMKPHATIIVCSTVAPAYMDELAARVEKAGRGDLRIVDCPVSGGPGRAATGTLSLFSSGDEEALSAPGVQAILACLSDAKKLYRVPGGLGAGSKAKLIHQIFAGVHIAVASEVMGLAAVAGLDTRGVFEEVKGGEGGSWMFGDRVVHMLEPGLGRYSAVGIIAKDVGIVSGTARGMGVPLPVMGVAEQLFLSAMGRGWGAEDDCVVVRLYLGGREGLVVERAGRAEAGEGVGVSVGEIRDLLVGVHLAVMSEAMAFCERLGIDVELMYDIVSNAAGASRVFERYFRDMKGKGWAVKGVPGVGEIRDRLTSAVAKAGELKYPLFLSSAALQELNRQLR